MGLFPSLVYGEGRPNYSLLWRWGSSPQYRVLLPGTTNSECDMKSERPSNIFYRMEIYSGLSGCFWEGKLRVSSLYGVVGGIYLEDISNTAHSMRHVELLEAMFSRWVQLAFLLTIQGKGYKKWIRKMKSGGRVHILIMHINREHFVPWNNMPQWR